MDTREHHHEEADERMRRTKRGCPTLVIALSVLLLGVVAVVLPADAAGPRRLTVVQLNICGNACNRGGLEVTTAVAGAIRAQAPFAVSLNEMCENQYAALAAELVGYTARFEPTGPRCHNGARYGNALLVHAVDVSVVGSWLLPNPAGDESRRLLCARTDRAATGLLICVTHISNEAGNVGPQVAAVAAILGSLRRTRPLILAGDLNADFGDARLAVLAGGCPAAVVPAACGPALAPAPIPPGAVTTHAGHSYDDVYLSVDDFAATRVEVTDTAKGRSDHLALWVSTSAIG
jgi:endonuclease/exonuclease/phosphatase family metal-dependent hydrolase